MLSLKINLPDMSNAPAPEQTPTSTASAEKARVAIAGGAGYTGGELLRILINHPFVELTAVHSRSNAGKLLHEVHADLVGDTDLAFTNDDGVFASEDLDVLFLCLGHGESAKFLAETKLAPGTRVIDLSHDFRLAAKNRIDKREFVYGLPELNRDTIRQASNIANPGCFATSIQLGLLPLAKAGLLEEVYTTGITGSTGAGQGLSATSHFSWRANNIQAYKTLTHQHLKEVYRSLNQLQHNFPQVPHEEDKRSLSFVPWRGDFTRGIFTSSTLTTNLKLEELVDLFEDYYRDHPFTIVNRKEVFLKQVVNTNKCVIHLEKAGSKLVVHAAIDNLLKGASGQAVQNMNLMMGWNEKAGLQLKANAF